MPSRGGVRCWTKWRRSWAYAEVMIRFLATNERTEILDQLEQGLEQRTNE